METRNYNSGSTMMQKELKTLLKKYLDDDVAMQLLDEFMQKIILNAHRKQWLREAREPHTLV